MSKQQELAQAEARLSELENQYASADEEQKNDLEPQVASQQQTVDMLQEQVAIEQHKPEEAFVINEEDALSFEVEEPANEFTATIGQGASDLELYEIQQQANEQEVQSPEVTMESPTTLGSYPTVDEFDNPVDVLIEVPNPNYPVDDQTQQSEPIEDVSEPEYNMQDFLNENSIEMAQEQEIQPPPPPQPEVEEPQA